MHHLAWLWLCFLLLFELLGMKLRAPYISVLPLYPYRPHLCSYLGIKILTRKLEVSLPTHAWIFSLFCPQSQNRALEEWGQITLRAKLQRQLWIFLSSPLTSLLWELSSEWHSWLVRVSVRDQVSGLVLLRDLSCVHQDTERPRVSSGSPNTCLCGPWASAEEQRLPPFGYRVQWKDFHWHIPECLSMDT
jgi:hypothetical protein